MPCSVHAMLHRTRALCLADKNSANGLQTHSRALICSCIAQADFRLRLLLPHPLNAAITGVHHHVWLHRWFYQPCRSSKLLDFLPSCCHWAMNSLSWTHAGEFWICEALLFILVRLRLPHDQHFKWFTPMPPASSEITKLLQEGIDKPVPSALGWQWSPLI